MPRKKKKNQFKLKLKKKTVFSIISVVLFALSGLIIFSFIQEGWVLTKLNTILLERLGIASLLLPFLLITYALFFSSIKTDLREPNVILGATVLWVSLLGITSGGSMGSWIWDRLEFLITSLGSFLSLFFGIIIGILVLFNTSLDQLITFITKVLKTIKRYFISEKNGKKSPIYLNDEKSRKQEDDLIGVTQLSLDSRTSEDEVPGPPPVLKSGQSPSRIENIEDMDGLLTMSDRQKAWRYPPISIFKDISGGEADRGDVKGNATKIEKTLDSFGVMARVVEINYSPSVTQYALEVALGTKLSKITSLATDLALALAAPTGQIRIEAPIPGRSLVGIEVPNNSLQIVSLKQILTSDAMSQTKSKLEVPLGLDVSGKPVSADIARMPHVLIAGQTGSGKSVLMNSWIATILFRASPDEVRLILVDPKRVEMSQYNGIPHLLTPVINEPGQVISSLKWAIGQMELRYKIFSQVGARNIASYNEMAGIQRLPYILIVIDELADIMLFAPAEVEDSICRIAQMARATGIHLILATQRPSVDVITGLIKANIPSRISFAVSSLMDSRVIMDSPGAEKLLGRGDMLYIPPDQAKPSRIQGPMVTDEEINSLIDHLKNQEEVSYEDDVLSQPVSSQSGAKTVIVNGDERDELFDDAVRIVVANKKGSTSLLQRQLKVGFSRAGRIMDQLEKANIVGPNQGSKPRNVLIDALPPQME
jgi:S-DNA-T family DNA segregation ATPase FtsK/SpoIIIE